MNLLIVGGFLGSGKTSILLKLARYIAGENPEYMSKVVIVENEIGEISVDDKVLSGFGAYSVTNKFSGCVCCTMSGELVSGLNQIQKDMNPELIILEATGVAFPHNIRETVKYSIPDANCRVCCVTDAKRWNRLLIPMGNLLPDQLDSADVILINKVDTVPSETVDAVEQSIRQFNDTARYFRISAASEIAPEVFEAVLGERG